MSAEALIQRKKCFIDRNDHIEDQHEQWMKKFGYLLDKEEGGSSEDKESEEYDLDHSEWEEEIEEK